jgi:hypothetical protein
VASTRRARRRDRPQPSPPLSQSSSSREPTTVQGCAK